MPVFPISNQHLSPFGKPSYRRLKQALLSFALLSSTALAISEPVKADDRATLEKLRAESLASPTNYDKSLSYVRAAIAARDYEAAIVVLERLLFYNPNLSGVRFELGNLYARLGSHAMAVHYYEGALAAHDLNEETRIRAEAYLALSRKELLADKFSGSVQFGLQYRSNPANLPDSIEPFPFDAPNDPAKYKSGGRTSLYTLGQINYRHDFQTGRGDQFEADLQAYMSRQFEYSELNFAALSAKAGPRIVIMPGANGGITLRPYVVGDRSWLDGESFSTTYGGGASLGIPLNHFVTIEPGLEWRRVDIDLTDPDTSMATLNSGTLTKTYVDVRLLAAEGVTITANIFASQNTADLTTSLNDLSSRTVGGTLSAKFDFSPPIKSIPFNWSIAPYVSYADINFDEENSSLLIGEKRHDRLTRIGAQLMAPISAQLGIVANIDYRKNKSNVDGSSGYDFNHDGWSTMIGAIISF